MPDLPTSYSAKLSHLKCFGGTPQGFDTLRPLNIIIGRNNSGKSALLDLVRALCTLDLSVFESHMWHKGQEPALHFETEITRAMIDAVFASNMSGGEIQGNHNNFGRHLEGYRISGVRPNKGPLRYTRIAAPAGGRNLLSTLSESAQTRFGNQLANSAIHPVKGCGFRSLAAERDIQPEAENAQVTLHSSGRGATNVIRTLLNVFGHDMTLIEKTLLDALNHVFAPDILFSRIFTRQLAASGPWEIFLEEKGKGPIPLSSSGSGIKTVVLALLMTGVMPKVENLELSNTAFAFEELENNLHPALLRRLLSHIAETTKSKSCITFITTHSNVVIDMFARNPDAQLLHVSHNGETSACEPIANYGHSCAVLDDLDCRPSDLLQANGIIWVEGPSDRTYINHWIDLWSGGNLKEGIHYQCVFYGGSLNAHVSAGDPDVDHVDHRIALLRIARNMCFVADSDKATADAALKPNVLRIREEVANLRGMMWITAGREVENYIPRAAFDAFYGWQSSPATSPFDSVFDYMDSHEAERGRKSAAEKPLLATRLKPHLQLEQCRTVLDLDERMTELCRHIQHWNGDRNA